MKAALALLVLTIACQDPVVPAPQDQPAALRFVGQCPRPALWWLRRDGVNLGATGLWWFPTSDSLTFDAVAGSRQLSWMELDGAGWAVQSGLTAIAADGSGRTMATCVGA